MDCEECDLTIEKCICARVNKFLENNEDLMNDLADLEEYDKRMNMYGYNDFYLEEYED